ncbi:MAG TPA: DUF87 domain-containing protein [Anaerolineae bacterium]|nr:DUF87 domain-containing protein [Anaerolineae bacterium]
MNNENLSKLTPDAEKIGIIGSPSSTNNLSIDILGNATRRKLVGELSYFPFEQDNKTHYAIGQMTEIKLNNVMLEDTTMKNLIREKGYIDSVSCLQDTYQGRLTISAVFGEENGRYFPSMLGTVPHTGTGIHLVDDSVLDTLLARYHKEIFYLGRVYGSTPKLPLWFKHFGSGENGAGEAYHMGIFGKTGSGKSVLAKMLLLAYARHPDMAIFVIDPQAEFSMDFQGEMQNSRFDLRMKQVLSSFNKHVIIKTVNELILQDWSLFTEIIRESNFFPKIGIKSPDEKHIAADDIALALKGKFKTTELFSKDAFFQAFKFMGGETSNKRFQAIFKEFSYSQEKFDDLYNTSWKPVCELFRMREGGVTIGKLLQKTLDMPGNQRPVVIINLSGSAAKGIFWNEAIRSLVTKSFLDYLKNTAEMSYRKNQFLNTLVILDEAHRLAPREETQHEAHESVRLSLIDAVRTTRKYGLGWLFISQTLASLPKEIIEQMRILFFGFGLAFGKEFFALKELTGGDENHLKLYQSFRDPHSAFDAATKQYNFMSIGPVSPLSFSGTPLFFTAYNNPQEFLKANRLV